MLNYQPKVYHTEEPLMAITTETDIELHRK